MLILMNSPSILLFIGNAHGNVLHAMVRVILLGTASLVVVDRGNGPFIADVGLTALVFPSVMLYSMGLGPISQANIRLVLIIIAGLAIPDATFVMVQRMRIVGLVWEAIGLLMTPWGHVTVVLLPLTEDHNGLAITVNASRL